MKRSFAVSSTWSAPGSRRPRHRSDGCWQRLAAVYTLLPGEQKAPPRMGERMRVHIGMSEWSTTTAVVAIRGPLAATPRTKPHHRQVPVHRVADPACELHQDWPTKPDPTVRCPTCRPEEDR